MPELIKRIELEFNSVLKKAMGIRDMKTKHSKSIESYLVRIVLLPCPLDMANLLYLPFSLCCLIDAFDLNRFLPCSAILSIPTMKISYMSHLIDHVSDVA